MVSMREVRKVLFRHELKRTKKHDTELNLFVELPVWHQTTKTTLLLLEWVITKFL